MATKTNENQLENEEEVEAENFDLQEKAGEVMKTAAAAAQVSEGPFDAVENGVEYAQALVADTKAEMRASRLMTMVLLAVISIVVGLTVTFYVIDVAFQAFDQLDIDGSETNVPEFAAPLIELSLIFGVLAIAIVFLVPLIWAVRKAR